VIKTPEGLDLREYQEVGVRHLLSGKCRLLLDDMGLGKTVQTIVAFNSLRAKKIVVVCLKPLVTQWAEEIKMWSTRLYVVQTVEKRLQKIVDHDRQVLIVPYSLIAHPNIVRQIKNMKALGVLVLDEIHLCKSSSALRTKACLTKSGIAGSFQRIWGLTGTAMPNTPKDLWPIMRTMNRKGLGKLDTQFKFYMRYNVFAKNDIRNPVIATRRLPELKQRLFGDGFALMRTKEEVLSELPPKQYRTIAIGQCEKEGLLKERVDAHQFDGARLGDLIVPIINEKGEEEEQSISALRRETGVEKVRSVCEYIDLALMSSSKIIVFAWHQDVIRSICEDLYLSGHEPVTYYGAMTATAKQDAKDRFINDPECKVFIGNIGSAGTGLNGLQKASAHAIFAELPWTYTELAQASDRLHRFGQKNPVLIDLTVLTDSMEEYIVKKILDKEHSFKQVFKSTVTI